MSEINNTENNADINILNSRWTLANLRLEPFTHRDEVLRPLLTFEGREPGFFLHVCISGDYYTLVHENSDGSFTRMVRIPNEVFWYMQQMQHRPVSTIN